MNSQARDYLSLAICKSRIADCGATQRAIRPKRSFARRKKGKRKKKEKKGKKDVPNHEERHEGIKMLRKRIFGKDI